MRRLLLFVGLSAFLCNPALAGKNAEGAMVVHTDDTINYTFFAPPDYCAIFPYAGDNCGDLNATSNFVDSNFLLGALVYYVAAFPPTSSPGVTVIFFGHDHNFAPGFISGWNFCGPPNSLEVPDAGWPGDTGAGNSVGFGSAIAGDLVFPFYWLGVYGDVGNYIGPRANPTGGYAGFVSDDNPGILDECFLFGTMRWDPEVGVNECPVSAPEGACCFLDGTCEFLTAENCGLGGGAYQGDGTVCDPNPCPQPGACCFSNGNCQFLPESFCETGFFIPDVPCSPNPCPQPGACCFPDGTCEYLQEEECPTGLFIADVSCSPNPCPQLGACCFADGTCQSLLEADCPTGDWREIQPCEPNPCPQPGACCDPLGNCTFAFAADCAGEFLGEGIPCDPNPCDQPPVEGACCFADGTCQFIAAADCATAGGVFQGEGIACDPNPCPQPGACCDPLGNCTFALAADCAGEFLGEGIPCDPNPCDQPPVEGACCFADGTCQFIAAADCATAGGVFQGEGIACDPNPCLLPGACCFADGSCQFVLEADCSGDLFIPESPCDPNPCPQPGPEFIRGDVNADGVVDLLDTHTFMLASRMPDPPCLDAADFNDDGVVDRDDLLSLIDFVFHGGSPPQQPYPQCGTDPTDDALDCLSFPPCEVEGRHLTLLDAISQVDRNGWIELSAATSPDGSRIEVPITLHATGDLLAVDLSFGFDPAVLRFVRLDRPEGPQGTDLAAARAERGGHLRLGIWSDPYEGSILEAGITQLGRLVLEILDPAHVSGSSVEITGGRLLAADRTYSEINDGGIVIAPGEDGFSSTGVSQPSFQMPNPIRPNSVISLALPQGASVTITLFSVHGRKIRTLLDRDLSSGHHELVWDGKTDAGQNAGPGIYYVNATIGHLRIDRKVVLVR